MAAVLDPDTGGEALGIYPLRSAVIGVLAHNEEATIEACLRAVLAEEVSVAAVRSIVVIASGCTDRTEQIVRELAADDARVTLVTEPERSGKAAAINQLLRETSAPVVVILGGDVVMARGSLQKLLEPLTDPSIGMTGARPIPTNPRRGLVGNAVNILWDFHHEVSLRRPKLGEAVAFKRVVDAIDPRTLVDEASIERLVLSSGLKLSYVPDAIVRNRGAETIKDFMAQRTRIYRGHLALAAASNYRVSSMDVRGNLEAAWRLWRRGESAHHLVTVISLEAMARIRAHLSRVAPRRDDDGTWHPIVSSKRVLADGHTLRSHHDGFQKLQLKLASDPARRTWISQGAVKEVRRIVRIDDRLRLQKSGLTITLRTDGAGARTVGARIAARMPGILIHQPQSVQVVPPE